MDSYFKFGIESFVQVRSVENKVARRFDSVSVSSLWKTGFILMYVYIVAEERRCVAGERGFRALSGV